MKIHTKPKASYDVWCVHRCHRFCCKFVNYTLKCSSTIVTDVHHPLYSTYIFRKGHVSKIKNRNFRKKSPPLKIYVSIVNCNICSWVMCGVPLCASISLYAEYSKLWHLTFIAHSDFVLPVNTNIPRYPLSLSLYVFVFSLTFVVVFPWNDWLAT